MTIKYPGISTVIHGNGAVAHVMSQVCGGVIGYPITPSTEISELFEAFRASGGVNVWGKHPFFFEPEGEHSAQSGALGAALTGGKYVSNASSSQGILYGLESHYVTVGKKVGGFVLHVAARVVSRHSLNVMAGHDDVYALLGAGYTILFGSNPQEAADLAVISYRVAADSLIPVANAMDGFATSHMLCEAQMPEDDLVREFVGDPAGHIPAPTVAQEILFGAKGRVFQLGRWLDRHRGDFDAEAIKALRAHLAGNAEAIEADDAGAGLAATLPLVPEILAGRWRRQWLNAHPKGARQRVPALVDPHNPGLTGGVQNQPDFQAGSVDHRTHFAADVPRFVRRAMAEYSALTGRTYAPVQTFACDDAETVLVGLGSVTDDAEAVAEHLRRQGRKVGVVSIKLLQPFPEDELVAALAGKKAVTVLERSDQTVLTGLVIQALYRGLERADAAKLDRMPRVTTAIFGLGAHDLQPRHLVAAYDAMEKSDAAPLVYLGSTFFSKTPSPRLAALQTRLAAAYPETRTMALEVGENPKLLPEGAFRVRFHSVGGYGTIATGKLLTDILAGVLDLHSKAAPKYGSEKSGAPTNYYITLSPEPVKITNAELEEVEIVVSPDHKVFAHANPLRGLAPGGTFILQSSASPLETWRNLPAQARRTIREKKLDFFVIDAFAVAHRHAPRADLETRMMGIAFIGAVCGHLDHVTRGASADAILDKTRKLIAKKFGAKGAAVVEGNMAVIRDGLSATVKVDYEAAAFLDADAAPAKAAGRTVALSAGLEHAATSVGEAAFLDQAYYDDVVATPFREGTIAEAPVLPGTGLFMPAGSAAFKDKGLFRRTVPEFMSDLCTGCAECALVCPDAAIPNTVHEIHDLILTAIARSGATETQQASLRAEVPALAVTVREALRAADGSPALADLFATAAADLGEDEPVLRDTVKRTVAALAAFPVARTRPFFDAAEKAKPGSGGLFSATIDPWKCSGCLECVEVCGPGALVARDQDDALLDTLQIRFDVLSHLPNTPARFTDGATNPGGDTKRLILDHANYYAMTGGHGACRGCGEVTAIRQVVAADHALHRARDRHQIRDLEDLLVALADKRAALAGDPNAAERVARIDGVAAMLEKRLYHLESGPSGKGPAPTVISNATGCSSVYASTLPFNPYTDPWVNSLFQDSPPLAKGIFEGLGADYVDEVKAIRIARLELDDAYDADEHDAYFRTLDWSRFTPEELLRMPTVVSMGGDGATYDIGFGALSRLLASRTPVKVVVLNSGAYSNTGGQASTASFTAQDSDLSRIGQAHDGKQEERKELGLIASFHPDVFVVQSSTALQGHFLKNVVAMLNYTDAPAVLDVYTPCQAEHGIADASASAHARLAVESRMNPVFVHDPRLDTSEHRLSLDGNPEPDHDWTKRSIAYVGADGKPALMETPLTPADFALAEGRFKKHFHPMPEGREGMPIHEYIDLDPNRRAGLVPFVWSTDDDGRLVKLAVAPAVVHLVTERRKYWRTLQYLAGRPIAAMDLAHRNEVEALKSRYATLAAEKDHSLDEIAKAMSELAASSRAPAGRGSFAGATSAASAAPAAPASASAAAGKPLVSMVEDAAARCTACKTCWQDIPELFEKTTVMVDGKAKEVGHLIPGAVETVAVTEDLKARIARVVDNCDAEIIR
ncbi:MAG: 2-oxoacid:acceptor oxidoreductase family protein [Hyphomicrobiales bacterium]|nr:2-oxoacid:acceptor oxidoreductase family protein [Hyphomicrobiales bacterium]